MEIIYENITEYYEDEIADILSDKKKYYNSFDIQKHSGGKRHISEPIGMLKHIQKQINNEIFYPKRYLIHKCAYAYIPNTNILQCIELHMGKKLVVKMDVKNFFGSITDKLVYDCFNYTFRMEDETAKTITELCTLDGVLPQGAATSPIISNFVCRMLDRRLCNYCEKHNIAYSRYADDMIFSGDFNVKELIGYASWSLRDYYGFRLNYDKLRVMHDYQRQVVLGVLVNQNCRLTKLKRHELRQALYYINKYGVDDYFHFTGTEPERLKGYVSYAIGINDEPFLMELWYLLNNDRLNNSK